MLVVAKLPTRHRMTRRVETTLVATLFLLPLFAGLVVFQWLPLLVAVQNSLEKFSPLNPDAAHFVGLGNYLTLVNTTRFVQAAINTLIYIFGELVLEVPLALLLALLVNQSRWGARITGGAAFAALIASEAVMALVWNIMYDPNNGLFNALLAVVGISPQPFLTSAAQALPSILFMAIWKDVGFTMLILLAGFQTIPQEFYEAAAIDGANGWAKLWFITIPLLKRMLLLATFMVTIAGSRIFTPIILMTQGGPENSSVNLVYYMYERAFQYQSMGEASATALIAILLLVVITLAQGQLLRTSHEY